MKKLSEFKDEQAINLVADLLPILGKIGANKDFANATYANPLEKAQAMLKAEPKAVMELLALLNETPIEEYHCSVASLIKDLAMVLSDKELQELF